MEPLLLKVDLSNRSYEVEEIPREIIRKYIGGRGLGSYLLYKAVPAKVDPLGEENHIIFTGGPASGTGLSHSSKACLHTKSPLTGIYLYSISSGTMADRMRKAGFWAIDIEGIASSPTFLSIHNQEVEFRDATGLWGMEPAQAQKAMLDELSSEKAATVAIGPAGERLTSCASVFCEGHLYRCFGRGGGGAVMGSKRLKGLVVSGDREIKAGDEDGFNALRKKIAHLLRTNFKGWAERWRRYETCADLEIMNGMGMIPTRNWQTGQFEGWRGVDKSTTPMGWPEKGRACAPYCPTPGCRDVEVKEGPYKGARSDVEWETVYGFGPTCGVDKMEAIIAASQICDEFGIDTITAGVTIGFAMECFEKGLIGPEDTDGIDLRFGNDEAMIAMLRKIANNKGFGQQLAKGTRWLSGQIKGSEAFAMHAKGLELGGYECRGANGQGLEFAINNRGGCHHGYGMPARFEIFDDTQLNIEGKGDYVINHAINVVTSDSLITCIFGIFYHNLEMYAETLSALFGESWTADNVRETATRIMCQERLFNQREGITRADDVLPARLLNEPKPDGPISGAVVPLEELKDEFYRSMGYELSTGNPSDALLAKLGIEK